MLDLPLRLMTQRRSAWVLATCALAMSSTACQDVSSPDAGRLQPPTAIARNSQTARSQIPDEYIVVFSDDVSDVSGRANALVKANGGTLRFTYTDAVRGFAAHLSPQAVDALANDPNVVSIEQDQNFVIAGTQSGLPATAWDLDRIDQRSATLDGSYTYYADGTGVTAYILDTGIRITNVEFSGTRATYGPDFISGTSSDDCNGHGTHMAGKVAGTFWGVAKNAAVVAVRVLDCSGAGSTSAILAGLDWVARNHTTPSVANLSFSGALSATVNQAVASVVAAGVTVVAAAGDYGLPADACQYSPASASSAITVGAMRQGDGLAGMSNTGTCVSLFAPGYQIASAWYTGDNIAWVLDGTSPAAAEVSGAAAVYLSAHPTATPAQVKSAIVGNATVGVLSNIGAGSPNLLLFVGDGTSSPPPPPPTNAPPTASFTASCSKANCTFNGSGSRDDSGIVSYSWSFGDGTSQTTTGATVTHTYRLKGKYSMVVNLVVTDGGGLTGSAQKTITINTSGK